MGKKINKVTFSSVLENDINRKLAALVAGAMAAKPKDAQANSPKLVLRIADKEYELKLGDSTDNLYTSGGHANSWYQKIIVCEDDRRWDGIMGSTWHEVMEMINAAYDLSLNHQTITTLSTAVHQVLRDNAHTLLEISKRGDHT